MKKLDLSLFADGEKVLVAVSGGADSVALLDLLSRSRTPALSLVVAHLNHSLRAAASDGDQAFVAALAESYRLPFVSRTVDVAALAADRGLSLEEAGRSARYAFFAEAAGECGATSIALAHHRDDQAETVLMRLLRGAGGTGLAAMKPVAGMLKRPLLKVSRVEIEKYLKGRGLTWRNDESNADTALLRNSIRHELLPFLRRYNTGISERLTATAEILAGDQELLERLTEEAFHRHGDVGAGGVRLDCAGVGGELRGLRLRLYRHAIAQVQGDLSRIALRHLEAIDALLLGEAPNARISLPGGLVAMRCYGELTICRVLGGRQGGSVADLPRPGNSFVGAAFLPRSAADRSRNAAPTGRGAGNGTLDAGEGGVVWSVEIAAEGSHQLPGGRLFIVERIARPACLATDSPHTAFFCVDAAPFPWLVRGFLPGDRIRPMGMQGEKKVKDLFIDEKIPRFERPDIPLVFSGGNLVWVCGIRVSELARIRGKDAEVYRVQMVPLHS